MSIIKKYLIIPNESDKLIDNNRYINNPKFDTIPPDNLKLSDLVIVYSNGMRNRIIDISCLKKNLIIYDKIYENETEKHDISITFCPYTLSTVAYIGRFKLSKYIYNNNIVLINENREDDVGIIQISGKIFNMNTGEYINDLVVREECKLMTLKNSLSLFPDSQFIKKQNNQDNILPETYYRTNKILYPMIKINLNKKQYKRLVLGIEYITSKINIDDVKKHTVIITKNEDYDIHNNGLLNYVESNYDKIKHKGGFLISCFYFAWLSHFVNTKVINL